MLVNLPLANLLLFVNRLAIITSMNIADYLAEQGLTQTRFAELCSTPEQKVTQGLVWQWMNGLTRVTPHMAVHIEKRVTKGKVTRRDLRPDDWHQIWPEMVTRRHPAPQAA